VIAGCRKCSLHQTRTRTVPGQGNPAPEILFVGEAPGADEDEQGLAFVGRAGQLLTKMIQAMGFERDEVFIANILKCRPPDNRAPLPEEMETCLPYLKEQIRLLKPKVIVALGATAVRGLVGLEGISKLRGNWLQFEGIDLMPTYHPAYLLRNPPAKKDVWLDLQEALRRLGRTPPKARSQG
jgi:DNA polymerase